MKSRKDISYLKQNRLMHFQIGLIIALGLALASINYTTQVKTKKALYDIESDDYAKIDIPITSFSQPKTPPPPPPQKVEVVEKLIEDWEIEPEPLEEPEPSTQPIASDAPQQGIPTKEIGTAPPAPPSSPENTSPIAPPIVAPEPPPAPAAPMKFASQMPAFKIQEGEEDEKQIRKFSDQKIVQYVSANVKYPAVAREAGIEGTAVIRFVVETDGSISDIKLLRDPGGGIGEAAKKVVMNMPKWERPGYHAGRHVRVYFTLPIKFELQE